MSAEEPPLALPTGLTPLTSGPVPLTQWQGRWWALAVLLSTLSLSVGLPWLADTVDQRAGDPDRVLFGRATIVPAEGWALSQGSDPNVVRLTKSGTWVEFVSTPADGLSAAVRVLVLADRMRTDYPQLTVASTARPFPSASRTPGQLLALAGTNQTSIVASVVEGADAVDVTSLGESSQVSKDIDGLQAMLESIRFLAAPDG